MDEEFHRAVRAQIVLIVAVNDLPATAGTRWKGVTSCVLALAVVGVCRSRIGPILVSLGLKVVLGKASDRFR